MGDVKDYLQTKFQYYPSDITFTRPQGEITLFDYLKAIKCPRPEIVEIFKEIEKASLAGDKKLKAELKAKLFYFTPAIFSNGKGRKYSDIVSWTGLMIVDIDGLEPEFAVEFKQFLFDNYPFFVAVFLSASKKGVKGIVRIPICYSTDEFKSYFYGLMEEFQLFRGIDFTSKNCALANYLTYDYDLLYRLDASIWDKKGIQVDEFKAYEGEIELIENPSEEDIEEVKSILTRMFAKIDDAGHIIVRSASLLGGGYVASNYIPYDEMKDFLFDLIEDTPYLHKSLTTYKKTCLEMLNRGTLAPVYLKKDER